MNGRIQFKNAYKYNTNVREMSQVQLLFSPAHSSVLYVMFLEARTFNDGRKSLVTVTLTYSNCYYYLVLSMLIMLGFAKRFSSHRI